jgi:hypothetical protein
VLTPTSTPTNTVSLPTIVLVIFASGVFSFQFSVKTVMGRFATGSSGIR